MKPLTLCVLITSLISCGEPSNPHRHFEKQRTHSDLKISNLNLATKQIKIRFEYRSHLKKTIETLSCDINFIDSGSTSVTIFPNVTFESFTTEVFTIDEADSNDLIKLNNLEKIAYEIDCDAVFDKGKEYISKKSTLHLIPGSTKEYR